MYSTADVLRFLLWALGGRAPYMSLRYLAFLAQYDVRGREVRKYLAGGKPLARAKFYLWGDIMSDEVADASEEFASEVGEVYVELIYDGPPPATAATGGGAPSIRRCGVRRLEATGS